MAEDQGDLARMLAERTRELQACEARFRNVIAKNADGIIIVDDHGLVRFVNPAAESLFNRRAEDLLGAHFGFPVVAGETTEIDVLRGGGQMVVAEMRVVETQWEGEHACLATLRDITDRKRAEEERAQLIREQAARREAEESSRMKDEFLATVSHELRTPLNAILGWVTLLRSGQLDDETKARSVETIERNARLQGQIIEDLLDVSRIISGKMHLDIHPLDLVPIIRAAVEAVRLAAEAKSIRLRERLDAKVGPVLGDPNRLQQIIWNLLSNAVKFTPAGGEVEVRLARADSHAEVQVSDTGIGISPEFLPYVFDRFRQADSTTTRRHGGLGLGLAIVRHLVELHGGTVQVSSDGNGKGATFSVRLPLTTVGQPAAQVERRMPITEAQANVSSLVSLRGLRVLVVEDEADSLEVLTTMLGRCGAEVRGSTSAAEALEALQTWTPHVLISDIAMPEEDGYALIGKIRALGPDGGGSIPALALTAYARAEDRIRALSAGYQMHLAKPVDPTELATVVASLASRSSRG